MPKMVSVEDAAEQLGLSQLTIRKWMLTRQIDYMKIGRTVKILQSTVDEILEQALVRARSERKPSIGVPVTKRQKIA